MRISHDLLRQILLDVANYTGTNDLETNMFYYPNFNHNVVAYHIHLLVEEGFLKAYDASDSIEPYNDTCIQLTLAG